MKRCYWLFVCLISLSVRAQEKLVVMGKSPDLYVLHTVSAETSLQAISNQFGQSVTKLSTYNGLTPNTTIAKGASIKIPLTQYNLIRTKGDDNSAPVYHIMDKAENLLQVSKENKLSLATLRQWNGLKDDVVKQGQAIIIGYMVNARINDVKLPEPKKEEPVKKIPEETTVVKAEVKPPLKKEEPIKKTEEPAAVKVNTAPTVKKEPAPVAETPVRTKEVAPVNYIPKEGDEGFFAEAFAQHSNEQTQQFQTGDAATFKTISGWSDRKYYVLMNDMAPETLVRITAPNNKSICAKVLGPLQETKGGNGLLLRMSNSAASTLGITDAKFTVKVTYYQ